MSQIKFKFTKKHQRVLRVHSFGYKDVINLILVLVIC